MTRVLNMGSHMKLTIFLLLLLLLSLDLSTGGGASGFGWGGKILGDPPTGVTAQMKMRKLMGVVDVLDVLDYDKDPGPNPKHEPPKGGGH